VPLCINNARSFPTNLIGVLLLLTGGQYLMKLVKLQQDLAITFSL